MNPTTTPDTNDTAVDENPTATGHTADRADWTWANTALNQLDTARRRTARFIDADPEGAARLLLSAIGTVAFGLLAVTALMAIMHWIAEGNPLQDLAGILPAYELVTDPLQQWFATHMAGTGIDTETAAWTWGITGAVIWVFACCNQLGAQLIAWPAFGIASAAMAWFGTTTANHRPVTAGLVAIAWTALSLFALNRRPKPRYRPRYIYVPTDDKKLIDDER